MEFLRICVNAPLKTSLVTCSTITVAVVLKTDFFETVPSILRQCDFQLFFRCSTYDPTDSYLSTADESDIRYIKLNCPQSPGIFQLHIRAISCPLDIIIVPYCSTNITISSSLPNNSISFLVKRHFHQTSGVIEIIENPGLSIGTHVWDAAMVLDRHLENLLLKYNKIFSFGVELGSGCCLGGIRLYKTSKVRKVVCTDVLQLMELMQMNINTNLIHQYSTCSTSGNGDNNYNMGITNCENLILKNNAQIDTSLITCMPLDWSNHKDIHRFKELHSAPPDIILAADVLYSTEMTTNLFHLIDQICTETTVIYIAQKIRKSTDDDIDANARPSRPSRPFINLQHLAGYSSCEVARECNVIVWEIMKKVNIEECYKGQTNGFCRDENQLDGVDRKVSVQDVLQEEVKEV